MKKPATIDEYIANFPKNIQLELEKMRATIQSVEPTMTETIAYGIPTFKLNGKNVVHFGGFATHIGFYPAPSGIEAFKDDLTKYQHGKGTLQFTLDQDIPLDLVRKVVKFRLDEILKK